MTDEEYQYHRKRAVSIPPLGECSRMRSGLIKIEGRAPISESELERTLATILQRPYSVEFAQKLRALA